MTAIPQLGRISDYVAYHAARDGARLCMAQDDRRWTYARLGAEVDAFARALLASGVAKGDRVAMLATPRPEAFLGFLAAASIGAIFLGLNPKFPPGELGYFVEDSGSRLLLGFASDAEGEHADVLRALGAAHACVERVVVLGDGEGCTSWDGWLAQGGSVGADRLAAARAAVGPRDPCLLVYTSGTTGRPKGALLPHGGLVFCSVVQAGRWPASPLSGICNLPVNHIGFMGDMSSYALVAGGTMHHMERFDPHGMLELIERERLTIWGQVPTMFALALAQPDFARFDLTSLQWIIWGGARAPREMIEALRRTSPGVVVATSFGMTETTGSVTYTQPDDDLDTLSETVGRPDPHFEVRIARPDGAPVAPGEEGEIQVRGEHIMLGYWRRPEATAAAIDADGWLHTGDVALLRPDGNFALRGRMSEMYKSGGENVYPREVEQVLEAHGAVALAAVLGVRDPLYGEVGHAYVIRRPGSDPTEDELRAFCRERLVNFKVPKRIVVADALPMLPIGKIDKVALRRERG